MPAVLFLSFVGFIAFFSFEEPGPVTARVVVQSTQLAHAGPTLQHGQEGEVLERDLRVEDLSVETLNVVETETDALFVGELSAEEVMDVMEVKVNEATDVLINLDHQDVLHEVLTEQGLEKEGDGVIEEGVIEGVEIVVEDPQGQGEKEDVLEDLEDLEEHEEKEFVPVEMIDEPVLVIGEEDASLTVDAEPELSLVEQIQENGSE